MHTVCENVAERSLMGDAERFGAGSLLTILLLQIFSVCLVALVLGLAWLGFCSTSWPFQMLGCCVVVTSRGILSQGP